MWFFRQKRVKASTLLLSLLVATLWATNSLAQSRPPVPLVAAESAVARMAQGDYKTAIVQARRALMASPEEATLHTLAGTLLLQTGDRSAALKAFQSAVTCAPRDGLALYGLGLAQLANGNPTAALNSFDRSEQQEGDRTYLLLARRYAQWLLGAQVALEGAGFPEAFAPAQAALEGMGAAKRGDWQQATHRLTTAQALLPGDAILQPRGLLMTFETTSPLDTASYLSAGQSLNIPLPKERGLEGTVTFTPDGLMPSVAFVRYEMEDRTLGLVSTAPFEYSWDTRQVSNGWHTLTVVLLSREAQEIRRITRRIRVYNTNRSALAVGGGERAERLREALWRELLLRPDRASCAYSLGLAQRALGDNNAARGWFLRAAALRPEYREVRQHLNACGLNLAGGTSFARGLSDAKVVAFTFDDGPKPGMTEPLLDILQTERVPATFFVIGRHVTAYPELTRKIAQAGMEFANHSYTHPNLTRLSPERVAQEVVQTQAAILAVTGKLPRFFRPPGGNWNPTVERIVKSWGLIPCFWTVDVYGAEVVSAQAVADMVVRQVRPGAVILMHNGKLSTLQALPFIIRELKRQGYTFVTAETLWRRWLSSQAITRATPPTTFRGE